jgi:hypothetical protein
LYSDRSEEYIGFTKTENWPYALKNDEKTLIY